MDKQVLKNKESNSNINPRNYFDIISELLDKYKDTIHPILPPINIKTIKKDLASNLKIIKILDKTQLIWPLQCLLLLDDPKKASGEWAYLFCLSLKKIGIENVLKNATNCTIYDLVMKENFEVFKFFWEKNCETKRKIMESKRKKKAKKLNN